MALRTLSQFQSALTGGGARPNLFEVRLASLPAAVTTAGVTWAESDATEFAFMCKATNLPASNIASIDVPFRGRTLKVAGDRTIDNWSVTIINDESFNLRTKFEAWTDAIAQLSNNTGATNPISYMGDAEVRQLGRGYGAGKNSTKPGGSGSAGPLRLYTFHSIFPVNVSSIDLSYDSSDTIEEFTVEFAVQSISIGKGGDEDSSDQAGATIDGGFGSSEPAEADAE